MTLLQTTTELGAKEIYLDIKHALGNLASSVLQMTVVYNHNYQPYLNGSNLAKKGEFLQEFHNFCSQNPEWDDIASRLTLDGATAHGAHSDKEARDLFKAFVLNCEHFKKKRDLRAEL